MNGPELDRPVAYVCHLLSGRARLRIPARRGDAEFFAMVAERVRGWPGITSVETNPITGSVLVYFTDPATALAKANESELFTLAESEPSGPNQPIATLTRRKVRSFDSRLRSLTSGAGDTRSVVFITLCAAGAYQLLRGNVAVPAFTYLWYAGDLLRLWHGAPKHDGSRAASDQ